MKTLKAHPSIVLFYDKELFYEVVKNPKRYFNVSLKLVLFLSLFAANIASLKKSNCCFTLTNVTFPQACIFVYIFC